MTEKSFKFALKHGKPGLHYEMPGSRTDRLVKEIGGKPAVRLSSSPIPLKQRKKTAS